MWTLGPLSFAAPLALSGFVALGVIWWLLRLKPPAPERVEFPAVRILAGLQQDQESPALTPLWLLILRLLLASLIILAVSHPLWNAGKPLRNEGPVYIIVDDDWAAAPGWSARQKMMLGFVDQAEREGRSMVVLTTAPNATDASADPVQLMTPADARRRIEALQPKPWPAARGKAVQRLLTAGFIVDERPGDVIWFSNGLVSPEDDGEASIDVLSKGLRRIGALSIVSRRPGKLPIIVRAPSYAGGKLEVNVERSVSAGAQGVTVRAMTTEGQVLLRHPVMFKTQEHAATARIALPGELYNRIARIEVEDAGSVGGVVLVDERWRRRPVGLLGATGSESAQPLLNPTHYLERALEPFTEIRKGKITELLKRPLAVLVLAGQDRISENDRSSVQNWMEEGGVVLRFAGAGISALGDKDDPFMPVRLRSGDRVFGGVMSWSKPAKLAPFDKNSPFYGLPASDEIEVRRQVLARPSPDLADKTWARLTDGTPLLTAARRGEGWLILVHTTASPEWSSLPLSGLFVDMLMRIIDLSQGVSAVLEGAPLAPISVLDAYAISQKPGAAVRAVMAGDFEAVLISPEHPPGFYGNRASRRALNLSTQVQSPVAIEDLPAGIEKRYYDEGQELDLRPWFLLTALVLFIIDTVVSLALRGLLPVGRAARGMGLGKGLGPLIVMLWFSVMSGEIRADEITFARENSLDTRLAYVLSGDDELDEVSRRGLIGLTTILAQRTAAELGSPQAVDPASDDLSFFPLLYWPVPDDLIRSDNLAAGRIREYMRNGGTILFDTRAQGTGGSGARQALRQLARDIGLPQLVPVPEGHVLSRAFYLMNTFPGRWSGGALWIERAGERVNDGVSPVIVGSHDWAGAWAMDDEGRPLFAVVPGGERQREMAFRFGINLVMYTLTGNYKADQVHLPAIMQRLGQ
jgi:hypothetical protein